MSSRQNIVVLDKSRIEYLTRDILLAVTARINERIVQEVTGNGDNLHVPSTAAIIQMIAQAKFSRMQPIIGNINEMIPIESRIPNLIYLQKDSLEDQTWCLYVWNPPDDETGDEGFWISLGNTEIDLSGYWSKSEEDIQQLKTTLGLDNLDTYVRNEQMVSYTEEEIIQLVNDGITIAESEE